MSKLKHLKIVKNEMVFDDFVKIERDLLSLPNQEPHYYYTLYPRNHSVIALAKTEEDLLIINREYRHPLKKTILSCAGGYLDKDEKPIDAARRELLEETGFVCNSYIQIGEAYPYPGISRQKVSFVYGKGGKKIEDPKLDAFEILETFFLSEKELLELIRSGEDVDSHLCTALFFLNMLSNKLP